MFQEKDESSGFENKQRKGNETIVTFFAWIAIQAYKRLSVTKSLLGLLGKQQQICCLLFQLVQIVTSTRGERHG